ncbi:MAG: ABC transporter [Acidobacteria bacterium]|nr:MAG: ABC transporter [Acidobacteriota bacterium]
MDAIRTEALTKHYTVGFWRPRPYVALDGLTLQVQTGEVFGFLGPNGAGKTTTLKLLMQLIFPTSGRADILGKPAGDIDVKRRIGYLPENPYFYDYLTAQELLEYFASLFGYSPAERRARAGRLLDEVGIGAERRLQLRKFAKGMLQRVGIAQALINEPEVVFLDEPMSCTVFFSSHVLADAETLCSRVAIMAKGRLVTAGALSDMLAFQVRGWELVVSGLTDAVLAAAKARGDVMRVTMVGPARHALDLPLDPPPEKTLAALIAQGACLVSLTPIRDTLEDFFVQQVSGAGGSRFRESA